MYRLYIKSQKYQKPRARAQDVLTPPSTVVFIKHSQQSDGKLSSGIAAVGVPSCQFRDDAGHILGSLTILDAGPTETGLA